MTEQSETPDAQGGDKQRGPNFPSMSLEKAVDLAHVLYEKEKRASVPVPVILGHWGYKNPKSSTATMAIAALRSYGLVDYQGGGTNKLAKLSTRALKIILNTPERAAELRDAALSPKIHRQLWERYKADGLPSDQTLKHHLILDLGFNDAAVDGFLARLRSTFSLAKLTEVDTISEKKGSAGGGTPPAVGDRVQWTAQGVMQFTEPPRVTSLSDDGQFVFVEGTSTGLPIGEVTVVEAATKGQKGGVDVISQAEAMLKGGGGLPTPPPVRPGLKQDVFTTEAGQFVVQWPASMSADDFEDVKGWLEILTRKIARSVKPDSE